MATDTNISGTGQTTTTTTPDTPITGLDFGQFGGAVAGIDPGSVTSVTQEYYDGGKGYNYTFVIQVPIPFVALSLDFNLLGDFILPALARIGIPQAITSFITGAEALLGAIVSDVQALLLAIPEVSVTILVKVGPVVVANLRLYAQREPVVVPIPTFVLALPNIAIDPDFVIAIPFPVPPPINVGVPIPIPVLPGPLVGVTGGNVSVSADASVQAQPQPFPIKDPLNLPTI